MNKLNLYLDVEEGVDREAVARLVRDRINQIENVQQVEAIPTETRLTGVEISAGIMVAVMIAKGANELVVELNKLMPEIKKLIKGIKEIKTATVEVGFDKVKIEDTDEAVIENLATEMNE